jgi:hypothetical protein
MDREIEDAMFSETLVDYHIGLLYFMHLLYAYVFLLLYLIVRLCTYYIFMYSLYVYVSSSSQLALFGYPD